MNEELHAVPMDDDLKHVPRHDCWCAPSLIANEQGIYWLHHADSLLCNWARRDLIRISL